MKTPRITPRRQLLQSILLLFVLCAPLVTIKGHPLFRFDLQQQTLYMGGTAFLFNELFIMLLLALLLLVGMLLVTSALGRVWCGWLCPQTILNDLVDQFLPASRQACTPWPATATLHGMSALIGMACAFVLLLWFMPMTMVLQTIAHPAAHPVAFGSALVTALLLYLDMALMRREFCRSYCPYGRFQTALTDESTLMLAFSEADRQRCIRCSSCVRTCPMGIDIRQGYQIECINCGRCIDACRDIMDRRGETGLIAYRFGENNSKRFLSNRSRVLMLVALLLAAVIVWHGVTRAPYVCTFLRNSLADVKTMPDGTQMQPWKAIIENRSGAAATVRIATVARGGGEVALLGPVEGIRLEANANRQIAFYLHLKRPIPFDRQVELRLLTEAGLVAVTTTIAP